MIKREQLLDDLMKCERLGRKSLEAVIEVIKAQPQIDCLYCTRREWYQKGYQDGLNADKWIPCEERLPRRNVDVLVYRPKMAMPFFVDRYEGFYGEDDNEWYEGWAYSTNCEVIAWQPLPQPYKKEGAENE